MAFRWFILLLCCSSAFGFLAMKVDETFKKAAFEKCKKQEKVPDAAMNDLYHERNVEGIKDYKCVAKCILEEFKVLKDGKIDIQMVKEDLTGHWDDTAKQDRIIKASLDCLISVKKSPDSCQYTYDIFLCFSNVLQKEKTEY